MGGNYNTRWLIISMVTEETNSLENDSGSETDNSPKNTNFQNGFSYDESVTYLFLLKYSSLNKYVYCFHCKDF